MISELEHLATLEALSKQPWEKDLLRLNITKPSPRVMLHLLWALNIASVRDEGLAVIR